MWHNNTFPFPSVNVTAVDVNEWNKLSQTLWAWDYLSMLRSKLGKGALGAHHDSLLVVALKRSLIFRRRGICLEHSIFYLIKQIAFLEIKVWLSISFSWYTQTMTTLCKITDLFTQKVIRNIHNQITRFLGHYLFANHVSCFRPNISVKHRLLEI